MELQKNSEGQDVTTLQVSLNQLGFKCEIDGQFGQATEAQICACQKSFNLVPSGVVNDIFWSILNTAVKNIQQTGIPVVITYEILKKSMPYATEANLTRFLKPLNDTIKKYGIDQTKQRTAMFLAQVAHESGELKYVRELASGDDYDTRTDLGNTPERDGDGRKYKGRALIQITGTFNYIEVSRDLGQDFINNPTLLEQPQWAAMASGWFWNKKDLNQLADLVDFKGMTKKINGGYNGWDSRVNYYIYSQVALGIIPQVKPTL